MQNLKVSKLEILSQNIASYSNQSLKFKRNNHKRLLSEHAWLPHPSFGHSDKLDVLLPLRVFQGKSWEKKGLSGGCVTVLMGRIQVRALLCRRPAEVFLMLSSRGQGEGG